jgi:hypothetical protein
MTNVLIIRAPTPPKNTFADLQSGFQKVQSFTVISKQLKKLRKIDLKNMNVMRIYGFPFLIMIIKLVWVTTFFGLPFFATYSPNLKSVFDTLRYFIKIFL